MSPNGSGKRLPQIPISFPRTPERTRKAAILADFRNDASNAVIPVAKTSGTAGELHNGDFVIAAITSCTNTSNPDVMIAAGLVAKKAVELGLTVPPHVKTSLAPGSLAVTGYLKGAGLQVYLDKLGFNLVGYGCTTCIGNSGPLLEGHFGRCRWHQEGREIPRRCRAVRQPQFPGPRARDRGCEFPGLAAARCRDGDCRQRGPCGAPVGCFWRRWQAQAGHHGRSARSWPRPRRKVVFLEDVWPTAAEIESECARRRDHRSVQ